MEEYEVGLVVDNGNNQACTLTDIVIFIVAGVVFFSFVFSSVLPGKLFWSATLHNLIYM